MKTWLNVARYHLAVAWAPLAMPWAILALSFVVNLAIFSFVPTSHYDVLTGQGLVQVANPSPNYTGGVAAIYVFFLVIGVNSIGRSLPFGLALGASRRSFYAGTALLGLALAVADGLVLTALAAIERATGGWGASMHFFRVAYILDGPWYLTWLTSFVALALLFVWGMWFGIVYRRWNLAGSVAFIAAQVTVVVAAVLIAVWTDAWAGVGHFFTGLTAAGLTGVLALLAVLLLAGGHATVRRASV
ncbi:MAG: hypothetical protein ABSA02_22100 [Trebonia sp.]